MGGFRLHYEPLSHPDKHGGPNEEHDHGQHHHADALKVVFRDYYYSENEPDEWHQERCQPSEKNKGAVRSFGWFRGRDGLGYPYPVAPCGAVPPSDGPVFVWVPAGVGKRAGVLCVGHRDSFLLVAVPNLRY